MENNNDNNNNVPILLRLLLKILQQQRHLMSKNSFPNCKPSSSSGNRRLPTSSASSPTTQRRVSESTVATQLLLHGLLHSSKSRQRKQLLQQLQPLLTPSPQDPYTAAIFRNILPMWASSTWNQRSALLQRFIKFRHALPPHLQLQPIGWQMSAFVVSTSTSPSTRAAYARTLRTLAKRMGVKSTPVLDLLIAGASVAANMNPTELRQARAISRDHVHLLIGSALTEDPSGRLSISLWLAWKTASRWSDILGLQRQNFLLFDLTANEVIIEWGDLKTNRRQRFKTYSLTVVRELQHPHILQRLRQVVARLPPNTALAPLSTQQLRRWLTKTLPRELYTAHSIKRGAIDALVAAAIQGRLDPRMIPLIAKHKDELHQFPASTLRYVASRVNLARMLGTAQATQLL